MKKIAFALVMAVSAAGAAAAAPVGLKQIQAVDDQLRAAVRAGNGAAVADLYAPDAAIMPSGGPTVSGNADIRQYWTRQLGAIADLQVLAASVEPMGPAYAREIGTFTLTIKSRETQPVTGRYVVIWKNVGGRWKLWTDIWNSTTP